ncbi:LOW QUALITY PROTEIN: serine protease 7 [Drosophila sulfurigaster albostrigata]|uniref:LOW QUALITY PROTEIN: serine protease 7 n=1 Tax=Drosophila sulfurigaster albostrigata TaxID=89887 RepID=UPI002D21B38F|nr:LOW QUALITY PROTEIN: serine protease 7 [Drosophila sulfurigaster albostrigata]
MPNSSVNKFTIMKVFIFLLCIWGVELTNGRYARCINPNQRAGLCVQISECQTLYSVLQQPNLSPNEKQFVRESGCGRGSDNRPFVCCTADTGYTRSRRITPNFPDYGDFGESFNNNFNSFDYGWNQAPSSDQRTVLFPRQETRPWSFGNEQSNDRGFGRSQTQQPQVQQQQQGDGSSLLPQPPACGGVTIDNKIYGGEDADLNEFPWTVLLEYRRLNGNGLSTSCAGTLINQRYIVTAAHCLTGRIVREIGPLVSARLGEHDTRTAVDCPPNGGACSPAAQRLGIEEMRVHELYKERPPNQMHDIGLVRLERDVRYSNSIQPVCLPSVVAPETKRAGQQYTVVGFGRTLKTARSPIKQKLVVGYVEPAKCRNKFAERKISIMPTQLCAGGEFSQDSCDGDSGGPLMRFRDNSWVLEGIVSFGYKCGLKDWPGVYTSVAAYDIWIKQNIRA